MANIHDYLDLRGDITLEERPFNVVDGLILSVLSYVDFTGIVPSEGEGPVTVSYACEALLAEADHVTATNAESGFATYLEALLG